MIGGDHPVWRVLVEHRLSLRQSVLLLGLAAHANTRGRAWPKIDTQCRWLGDDGSDDTTHAHSRRLVRRDLRVLEARGLVVRAGRHPVARLHPGNWPVEYRLPWLEPEGTPESSPGAETGDSTCRSEGTPRVDGRGLGSPPEVPVEVRVEVPPPFPVSSGGNGTGPPGGGGDDQELEALAHAAALRQAEGRRLTNPPAWVRKATGTIAAAAGVLLVEQPALTAGHAVAIAAGESPPVVDAPERPTCDRCDRHLDVPSTCSLALYDECPHGRDAPR